MTVHALVADTAPEQQRAGPGHGGHHVQRQHDAGLLGGHFQILQEDVLFQRQTHHVFGIATCFVLVLDQSVASLLDVLGAAVPLFREPELRLIADIAARLLAPHAAYLVFHKLPGQEDRHLNANLDVRVRERSPVLSTAFVGVEGVGQQYLGGVTVVAPRIAHNLVQELVPFFRAVPSGQVADEVGVGWIEHLLLTVADFVVVAEVLCGRAVVPVAFFAERCACGVDDRKVGAHVVDVLSKNLCGFHPTSFR